LTRLTNLLKKLESLEQEHTRETAPEIPACMFLPSSDFENEESREIERKRLRDLYGDACHLIVVNIVGPAGSDGPVWKGDLVPSTEEILASPEYRKAERQYYEALAGKDPDLVLQAMSDETFLLLEAGVIQHNEPKDTITPPSPENARQTSIAPAVVHEDKPGDKPGESTHLRKSATPDRDVKPAKSPVILSAGCTREDCEPIGEWKLADYERQAYIQRGKR
jgi:hypothetical protein